MLAILTSAAGILSAIGPIIGLVVTWLKAAGAQSQQNLGAQIEAGKVNAASADAEAAIVTADAAAPTTKLALVDRLKAGNA